MSNQIRQKNILFMIAAFIIVLWVAPYFILGEDSHMRVHDNLDSNLAWYEVLKNSGQLFAPVDAPIEQIINGELKRNAFYSEYYAMIFLFMIFPSVIAYGLSQLITRILAFIGMYLLLRDFVVKDKDAYFIHIGVALLFSLIPYWPSGMLSYVGMPLALWAFLYIRKGESRWYHYFVLTVLPFLSSFVLGFFYFLAAMGIFWFVDLIRTKKWNFRFIFSILYMLFIYLLIDYRLVVSMLLPHETTNRDVFINSKNDTWDTILLTFKNYIIAHNQDQSVHHWVILPLALGVLVWILWKKRWREEKLFIGLHIFHFALSLWYAFWWHEMWQPLKENISILTSYNFSRFHYFSPAVVYALFALTLYIIMKEFKNRQGVGEKRSNSFRKVLAGFFIFTQFIVLVPYNEQIYYRNSPSFKEFFAVEQFEEIKEYIGKPQSDYRVVSIGIHPAISQYNGFYTLDTYNNIYPLTYKMEFRKIIEKELAKNKSLEEYYDHWGGRVYIFVDELGKNYEFSKRSKRVIKNLELNVEQLKKMGGEYVLSALPIENAEDNRLKLEKNFEHPDSFWNIYLYKVE